MAPARPSAPAPADLQWIALRGRHDEEVREFHRKVDAARETLLARHQKEEREYWVAKNVAASPADSPSPPTTAKNSTAKSGSAKSLKNPSSQLNTSKSTQQAKRQAKNTPATKIVARPAARPAKKIGHIEVVDLCSDDDDDPPPTRPSAQVSAPIQKEANRTLQHDTARPSDLQKENVPSKQSEMCTNNPVPVPQIDPSASAFSIAQSTPLMVSISNNAKAKSSYDSVKVEEGADARISPQATPFQSPFNNVFVHAQPSQPRVAVSQTGYPTQPSPFACTTSLASPSPFRMPTATFGNTDSRLSPNATGPWTTPPPSQQKRSQGGPLGSVTTPIRPPVFGHTLDVQKNVTDVNGDHDFATPTRASLQTFSGSAPENNKAAGIQATFSAGPSAASVANQGNEDNRDSMDVHNSPVARSNGHLSSPSRSSTTHILVSGGQTEERMSPFMREFKRPFTPEQSINRHSQTIVPPARSNCEQSVASSFTMPLTPSTLRINACMSASALVPRQSIEQATPASRKRRIVDLSDEEDASDNAPSEPSSPLAEKSAKVTTQRPDSKTAPKKQKIRADTANATKNASLTTPEKRGKYSFQTPKTHTTKSANAPATPPHTLTKPSVPSTPSAPAKPSARTYTTPPTPCSPSVRPNTKCAGPSMSSQPRPSTSHVTKASPKAKPLSRILFSSPSRRAASRRAEDKIQGYFTAEEEFHTKTAIEDANAFEESAMFTGMRSMSLTPGAKGRVVGGDEMGETVESLALPDDSVNDMVQDLQNDGDAGGKVVDQGNYRRPTVRDAGENGEEDEVDEEVDISDDDASDGNWEPEPGE